MLPLTTPVAFQSLLHTNIHSNRSLLNRYTGGCENLLASAEFRSTTQTLPHKPVYKRARRAHKIHATAAQTHVSIHPPTIRTLIIPSNLSFARQAPSLHAMHKDCAGTHRMVNLCALTHSLTHVAQTPHIHIRITVCKIISCSSLLLLLPFFFRSPQAVLLWRKYCSKYMSVMLVLYV